MTSRFLHATFAFIGLLSSCSNKPREPVRDLKEDERFHAAGLVLIPDLEHAKVWRGVIHERIGVPDRKIEVQAGPGYTTIFIHDLNNRADAETIAQALRNYAEKNVARMGPTKVEVQLKNAPPTINPFVLPNEMGAAGTKPGSVLPTLSLPPLLPGVR